MHLESLSEVEEGKVDGKANRRKERAAFHLLCGVIFVIRLTLPLQYDTWLLLSNKEVKDTTVNNLVPTR